MINDEETGVALVLIDVIDDPHASHSSDRLEAARRAAPKILALRERAHEAKVPVIYVNHEYSPDDVSALSEAGDAHHVVTRMLAPTERDHSVVKSRASGFDATELDSLLKRIKARTIVLAGFSADADILSTATDARARGYDVIVPADCTAASSNELTQEALDRLRSTAGAGTDESSAIDLLALRKLG